jgi:hypothetical protein
MPTPPAANAAEAATNDVHPANAARLRTLRAQWLAAGFRPPRRQFYAERAAERQRAARAPTLRIAMPGTSVATKPGG